MSLLDTLKSQIPRSIIVQASTQFGETEGKISTALQCIIPTFLHGIADKSNDNNAFNSIFQQLRSVEQKAEFTSPEHLFLAIQPGTSHSPSVDVTGKHFLTTIFGNRLAAISGAVSSFADIKPASSTGLLGLITPFLMGTLGQYISKNNLNFSEFSNLLNSEKSDYESELPLQVSGLLAKKSTHIQNVSQEKVNWLLPIMFILLAAALLVFLVRACRNQPSIPPANSTIVKDIEAPVTNVIPALGHFFKRKLSGGKELNIPRFGMENKVIDFIEDAGRPVDKTSWFSFDRLTFETGSSQIKAESSEQLSNIAAIMKAYPNVNIKIGGYTDNSGDPQANLKLSADRALAVRASLMKSGVDSVRIDSEGYGEQNPITDNSTEAGKAKNRRVDLKVTKK